MAEIVDTFIKDEVKLGVIGCGKMASAILSGIVKSRFLIPDDIYLYDVNMEASADLCRKYGFREAYSIKELMQTCDVILLAVKPFKVSEVLFDMKDFYSNQLVLSILAGVKIRKYLHNLKNAKIVRIMPNTPALVNEGMSAICVSDNVTCNEYEFAFDLMSKCGRVIKTTEDKIDIMTALSGSGPAFYFKIIECMAKSAIKLGLNEQEALLLSSQTALGSAKMVLENNFDINQLILNVTTPGGCTEVGNEVLNCSSLQEILDETIKKTMEKAIELG